MITSLFRITSCCCRHFAIVPSRSAIVNLGTGYETLGISKAGTIIQSQSDVESTVTLHNLLFLVRKLISNKLVEALDRLSCRKKRGFVGFCAG